MFLLVVHCIIVSFYTVHSSPLLRNVVSERNQDAKGYLMHYGYYNLPPADSRGGERGRGDGSVGGNSNVQNARQFRDALRSFQSFAGLSITGVLDDATKRKMSMPRCGVPDLSHIQRDSYQFKWNKTMITWTIDSVSSLITMNDARRAASEAFAVWSKAIPLDFSEVSRDDRNADIRISFGSRDHGDPWPFDGPGNILAHALYPPDGRMHFDNDERWTCDRGARKEYEFTDFLSVAVHELGHALGLGHSTDQNAIMAAFYQIPESDDIQLQSDDIYRIQRLYGRRTSEQTSTTKRPRITTPWTTTYEPRRPVTTSRGRRLETTTMYSSSTCLESVDAGCKGPDGTVYWFSGTKLFQEVDGRITSGSSISDTFPQGPTTVTTAVYHPHTDFTLLFKGRQIWAYTWDSSARSFHLHPDFPKTISPKVLFVPMSAFIWSDGNLVLLDKTTFVTYDENWNVPTMVNEVSNYFDFISDETEFVIDLGRNGQLLSFTRSGYRVVRMLDRNKATVEETKPLSDLFHCL